jgi:transposase
VASDVFGKSGGEILRALIQGETSPEQMASLARGRLRQKLNDLEAAVTCDH